jgi:hypothetical protein
LVPMLSCLLSIITSIRLDYASCRLATSEPN